MTDGSSDLSDDIVPESPQHFSLKRTFAPWHKVRKEYVRKEQWNNFLVRYAKRYLASELQDATDSDEWSAADNESSLPNSILIDRPLKCLVLPGDDLLDIRALHRDTEDIQCYIRYLGFNSGHGSDQAGTRIHVSHNDVTSLDRVSNDSIVVHDLFQRVASKSSQAYRYLKQLGPFHVVNLDLCDSLFPNQHGDINSYFDGLHSIADFQMKLMATPWLLFITTEVAPSEVDAVKFDKLCEPTKKNLQMHANFEEAFAELVPKDLVNIPGQPVNCSGLNEKQLIDLFGIAIGKALLSFCSTAGEKWKVVMLPSHIYSINKEKNVSMLSLAFQFSPISHPPQDTTGLSSFKSTSPQPFDESELATKIVKLVKNITDIDNLLSDDEEKRSALLESSADLLRSAGYDKEAYKRWVSDGEQST